MKKSLTLVLLILTTSCAFCQQTWVKRFSSSISANLPGDKILNMPDGNFITIKQYCTQDPMTGLITDFGFVFIDFSQAGDTNWTRTYSEMPFMQNLFLDAIVSYDTCIIMLTTQFDGTYHKTRLYKFDGTGNLLWIRSVYKTNESLYTSGLTEAANQDILIGGWTDAWNNLFIARFNSYGTFLWNKTYSIPGAVTSARGIAELNNEIIMPFSLYENGYSFKCDYGLMKTDSAGNVIYCKAVKDSALIRPYGSFEIFPFKNNGFVLGGKKQDSASCDKGFFLNNYDNNGNLLWAKHYHMHTNHTFTFNFSGVNKTSDGSFLVTANYGIDPFFKLYPVLIKIGSGGNIKWAKQLGFGGRTNFSALQTQDNGIIFSAGCDDSSFTPVHSPFLVKTDSLGNNCLGTSTVPLVKYNYATYDSLMPFTSGTAAWNFSVASIYHLGMQCNVESICTPVAVNEFSSINKSDINIYPNPAHSKLNILFNESANFLIINTLGEIVMEQRVANHTPKRAEVNVSFLSPGVYFIRSGSSVRKFVKE